MQGQKTLSSSNNMHLFLPYLLNDSQTIRSMIQFFQTTPKSPPQITLNENLKVFHIVLIRNN